jgi:hypothetical protein
MDTDFGVTRYGGDCYRGITFNDDGVSGLYTAFTPNFCRDFKTLRGAVAYLSRLGIDAHGRRNG